MKKISTAATKPSRNFSQQKLTIGLDLGDRSSCYCVLDESGHIVMEQKVSTTAEALQAAFGAMPRSRIALETGMHSPWISRLLSGVEHQVIVAHAQRASDRGEPAQRRSAGCADVGAAGAHSTVHSAQREAATGCIRLLFHCEKKKVRIPFNLQDDGAGWARLIEDIFQISDIGHRPEVD